MKKSLIFIFILSSLHAFSQKESAGKLLYSDNFNTDLSNWKTEFETPETSSIKLIESKLDLVSSKGATIWFKTKLSGNVMITYDETLVERGGSNDRVSDMNVFWMAADPLNPKTMIERDGKFSSYDNLNLYYAGVGGHYNKFTRFRKYNSNGEKPVLKEYSDIAHLLVGNKKYSIKIIVNDSLIQYFLNNELYWELKDETPYKEGYFGFRTTISHQQFENFKVFRLN
jgi:rhamnogalacturonan endolyase